MARLLSCASVVAWLGAVLTVVLAPSVVSLLREVLLVGCAVSQIGGQGALSCRDGNGYLLPAAPLAALLLAGAVALVWLQGRLRRRPTVRRWRALSSTILVVPLIPVVAIVQSPASITQLPTLALVAAATATVVVSIAVGRFRRLSAGLAIAAAVAFAAAYAVESGVIAVAALGLVIAVVSALDRIAVAD